MQCLPQSWTVSCEFLRTSKARSAWNLGFLSVATNAKLDYLIENSVTRFLPGDAHMVSAHTRIFLSYQRMSGSGVIIS